MIARRGATGCRAGWMASWHTSPRRPPSDRRDTPRHDTLSAGTRQNSTTSRYGGRRCCPGWTRAHVVAHLSRNADALHAACCRRSRAGRAGADVRLRRSPGRATSRRPSPATTWPGCGDARRWPRPPARPSAASAAVDRPGDAVRRGCPGEPPFSAADALGHAASREVEIHHADLDAGYTAADWPPDFSPRASSSGSTSWPRCRTAPVDGAPLDRRRRALEVGAGQGPEIHGTAADLAWWLVGRGGRGDGPDLLGGDAAARSEMDER